MVIVIKLVLLATYPLLLLARIGDMVRGRDPLRLTNPRGSMWIARRQAPPAHSYFSVSQPFVPSPSRSRLLARVARVFAAKAAAAPRRTAMPDEIPDEVYTLW
jgi:hypothetical protein